MIGICNGFQILLEAGMLPGAMHQNEGLKFVCKLVNLRVENNATPFTAALRKRTGQSRYRSLITRATISSIAAGLAELEGNGQIVVRYCDEDGEITQRVQSQRIARQHRRRLQP